MPAGREGGMGWSLPRNKPHSGVGIREIRFLEPNKPNSYYGGPKFSDFWWMMQVGAQD